MNEYQKSPLICSVGGIFQKPTWQDAEELCTGTRLIRDIVLGTRGRRQGRLLATARCRSPLAILSATQSSELQFVDSYVEGLKTVLQFSGSGENDSRNTTSPCGSLLVGGYKSESRDPGGRMESSEESKGQVELALKRESFTHAQRASRVHTAHDAVM